MTEARGEVLCFGEVLWDFLPDGRHVGGAPLNVAYHLQRLGLPVRVVSAVGADDLGDELLRQLRQWHLRTDGVARQAGRPTGQVRAALGPGGDARYEIGADVAWDRIELTAGTLEAAAAARAIVFGSLAQRSAANRRALGRLLAALPVDAARIFDVNLRPPHDDLALVRSLARRATVLKLNADEAARLAETAAGGEEACARHLRTQSGCAWVCVTAGARGAGLLHADRWRWEPARPVAVGDTVGAGDAFLAAWVFHFLGGSLDDVEILARACRLGEWVAARHGATPPYDASTPV